MDVLRQLLLHCSTYGHPWPSMLRAHGWAGAVFSPKAFKHQSKSKSLFYDGWPYTRWAGAVLELTSGRLSRSAIKAKYQKVGASGGVEAVLARKCSQINYVEMTAC